MPSKSTIPLRFSLSRRSRTVIPHATPAGESLRPAKHQ
jgi:hypothetical protein